MAQENRTSSFIYMAIAIAFAVVALGFLIMKLNGGFMVTKEETVQDISETDFSQLDETVSGL